MEARGVFVAIDTRGLVERIALMDGGAHHVDAVDAVPLQQRAAHGLVTGEHVERSHGKLMLFVCGLIHIDETKQDAVGGRMCKENGDSLFDGIDRQPVVGIERAHQVAFDERQSCIARTGKALIVRKGDH